MINYKSRAQKKFNIFRTVFSDIFLSWKSLEILAICKNNYNRTVHKKTFLSTLFPIWFLLSCFLVIYIFIYYIKDIGLSTTLLLSIFLSLASSLATYCTLRFKSREFCYLKNALQNSRQKTISKVIVFINILQIVNLLIYLSFIMYIIFREIFLKIVSHSITRQDLLIGAGKISFVFYQIAFPFHMTFVFASFYCSCTIKLKIIRDHLKKVSIFNETNVIFNIFLSYRATLDIYKRLENALSASAFFLSIVHYMNMFLIMNSLLGRDLLSPNTQNFEDIFSFVSNFTSFSALIGFASETSTVFDDIRLTLCEIREDNALYGRGLPYKENKRLINAFMKRENVVFSAWNIVYFRKSLILASYGTFISYSFLLFQYK